MEGGHRLPTFVPLAEYVDRVVAAARKSVSQKKEARAPEVETRAEVRASIRDEREALARKSPAGLPGMEDSAEAPKGVAGDAPGGTPAPPAVTAPGGGLARPTRVTGADPRG